MASNLFSLASKAVQRLAAAQYGRTPVGRAAALVRNLPRGSASSYVKATLGNRQAQRLIREVTRGIQPPGESVERYSQRASSLLGQLLSSLGPIGEAIRLAVGGQSRSSLYGDQLESAIALIRALGGEYLTTDKNSPHYRRGIEAAKKALGSSGELDPAAVMRKLEDVRQQIESGGGGQKPPGKPPTTGGGDWPDEHGMQTIGRDSASYDAESMEAILAREIKTPDSSNVYSFVFEEETDPSGKFYQRSGILYVTFRPWHPGMKEKRPNSPGAMYAYYDVPLRRYKSFASAATNGSAGGAVWDYLRVRGSKWDHRFPYRIVAGVVVPAGGIYVPRKATSKGYKRRTLAHHGIGKRGFIRSQLPEQTWEPNRGWPNRGGPDRGEPNRGK